MKAVILVAGVGKRLRGVTGSPKCLLKIGGVALIERYLSALAKLNVRDVVLVVGYEKERVIEFVGRLSFPGNIEFVENPDFTRGSILSLYRAMAVVDGDFLLMDGDVYFESEILKTLVRSDPENLVAVDTKSSSSGEEVMVGIKGARILDMSRNLAGNYDVVGEAVGFYKLGGQGAEELRGILEEQVKLGKHNLGYEDILPLLFQRIHFRPLIVDGLRWVEIDFEEDVGRAESLANLERDVGAVGFEPTTT